METIGDKRLRPASDDADLWQDELVRFAFLAILGAAASYLSVNIPYTEVFIEGRWLFGYMGFALLNRWWMAFLLACLLSVTGFHKLPLGSVFIGNMLYAFPILLVIRFVHKRMLDRLRALPWYGIAWLFMIMLCYQVFTTPVIWGFLAFLQGNSIWLAALESWREQPFLIESLLVGIISALAMMVIRSNAALRASRQELATTLYSIGDGVIATDANGRVRRMNPVAENLTGWSEAEAMGKPLETVFYILNEETRASVENPVLQVLKKGIVVGLSNHTLLVSQDGTELPIVDSAAPIRDRNDLISGVVLVFRDQTEERAAQRNLEEIHSRLLLALRNARMGIWDWDVSTNRVDWHGEHSSLFGIPIEAFGGTIDDVQKSIHPDDREQSVEIFHRTVETGADFYNTYRVVWPDGSVHWMHSYGKLTHDDKDAPRRIVGTTQDITKQMWAEEAYRTLVENSLQGLVILQDGLVAFANPAMTDISGYTVNELFSLSPEEVQSVVHPNDRDRVLRGLSEHITEQEIPQRQPFRFLRKDGTVRWVESFASRINYRGRPAIQVAYVDITEQKRAEKALREHREHLEELVHERTAELRKMVNAMAGREVRMAELKGVIHELRTQLKEAGLKPVADDPLLGS